MVIDQSSSAPSGLYFAALFGLRATVECFLKKGYSPNQFGFRGLRLKTPALVAAVEGGFLEVVELLLEWNADINFDEAAGTALHSARKLGWNSLALKLRMSTSDEKENALHIAIKKFGNDAAAVKEWVTDQNIHGRNSSLQTPLHVAAEQGNFETVKLLMDCGAEVDALSSALQTPLHLAAIDGEDIAAAALSREGTATPHKRKIKPPLTIKFVAQTNDARTIVALISRSADVNAQGTLGQSPLHLTASSIGENPLGKTATLLRAGSNPRLLDEAGRSPLHVALFNERKDVAELLEIWIDKHGTEDSIDNVLRVLTERRENPRTTGMMASNYPSDHVMQYIQAEFVSLSTNPCDIKATIMLFDQSLDTNPQNSSIKSIGDVKHPIRCRWCNRQICGLRFVIFSPNVRGHGRVCESCRSLESVGYTLGEIRRSHVIIGERNKAILKAHFNTSLRFLLSERHGGPIPIHGPLYQTASE